MGFSVKIEGVTDLEKELNRLNSIRWEAVRKKQAVQMLNRARASGGTPVSTGELRKSAGVSGEEMGYIKEYAPHVEYGHRLRNGGFVPGQYYLKKNVDVQEPIYRADLLAAIRKG